MKLYDNDAWLGGISNKIDWAWAYGLDNNYAPVSDYTRWEEGQPGYGDYGMYYIRSDLRTGEWDDKGSPDTSLIEIAFAAPESLAGFRVQVGCEETMRMIFVCEISTPTVIARYKNDRIVVDL